jgi:pimeloyl-ACP methyl ester carboxylesterase
VKGNLIQKKKSKFLIFKQHISIMLFETVDLTNSLRDTLPGKHIKLSKGEVYYDLQGPQDGEVIVFVHGFSVPNYCWDPNFEFLLKAGYRVLRYDLYGRGYSDRPTVTYNADLFDNQLWELLTALNLLKKKIKLIGLSMGGLIAINFADRHSEVIEKVSLVDPAGFPIHKQEVMPLLKIPGLNKIIFKKAGIKRILERSPINLYQGIHNPKYEDYRAKFLVQFQYRGIGQALLSTLLNMPLHTALETYKSVVNKGIPLQLFWGEFDEVLACPSQNFLKEHLPNAEFHLIPNAGHTSNYEQPDAYHQLLLPFLKK